MTKRPVLGSVALAVAWLAAGCDRPEQVHIIIVEPHATKARLEEAERVLEGVRVRLREHGFVEQEGVASAEGVELWLWREGRPDALEVRVVFGDGITVTLRQPTGERGAEFMGVLNELSGVVDACMSDAASPPVSAPTQP